MINPLNLFLYSSDSGDISDLDCAAVLKVVYAAFEHPSILTRLAALRWVEVLLVVSPEAVFANSSDLMPLLLKLLSDPAVEVSFEIVAFRTLHFISSNQPLLSHSF